MITKKQNAEIDRIFIIRDLIRTLIVLFVVILELGLNGDFVFSFGIMLFMIGWKISADPIIKRRMIREAENE